MLCPETQIPIYIWPPSEVMVGGWRRREEGAAGVQGQRKLKKKKNTVSVEWKVKDGGS